MRVAILIAIPALATAAYSQRGGRSDTTRANPLDPVVITAERVPTKLSATASTVSRLDADALRRTPNSGFADWLRLVPGFALVDFDGLGRDPGLMLRGFYGGGEAEYVVVLVDGEPVNQLHTGRVPWDALPNATAIEAVEVLRGGASPLYGDAALAGVINVVTRKSGAPRRVGWSIASGSYNTWRLDADASGGLGRRPASMSLALDHGDGFRRHSERTVGQARANLELVSGPVHRVSLGLSAYNRDYDEPGPLLDSVVARDRRESDALFRFDHTKDRNVALHLTGDRQITPRARISTTVLAELRDVNAKRTVALAPGFGDTRDRDATTAREHAGAQLEIGDALVGAELSRGSLDSRYYEVFTGPRPGYAAADGSRGDLSARGDASRTTAALFTHMGWQLSSAARLSLGARADWLRDAFDAHFPDDARQITTTHAAISPKASLNVRYSDAGHFYASASRSFKAPTLDQLFDQRPIPVPFPPFTVTTSNATLGPQYGANVEAGFAHNASTARYTVSLNGSVYHMAMRNELDFDVTTLRYVNIGRSRHRGIEAGFNAQGNRAWSLFGNYALQAVTARSGASVGKSLKAIPRHALTGGFAVKPLNAFDLSVVANHSHTMFLDDANTHQLPNYMRIDAQLTRRVASTEVVLELRNLLDSRFNSTGFLDPSASGAVYYLPAAGRVFSLGIRSRT